MGGVAADTDGPEDMEVKSRLAAVGEAIAALDGFVGSCREAIEAG